MLYDPHELQEEVVSRIISVLPSGCAEALAGRTPNDEINVGSAGLGENRSLEGVEIKLPDIPRKHAHVRMVEGVCEGRLRVELDGCDYANASRLQTLGQTPCPSE